MKKILNDYGQLIIAAILVSLFFLARSCQNDKYNQQKGENQVLKEEIQKVKDGVKVQEENRLREKDSVNSEIQKKDKAIKELKDKLSQSDFKIAGLEVQRDKEKLKVKSLTYAEAAKEYNEIYKTNNAEAVTEGVTLKKNLPNLVLETVADANYCQEIVKEKDKQLTVFDSIVSAKDNVIKNKDILLVSAEKSVKANKELNQLQTNLNNSLEKENKKLRTKNLLDKVLIPVAAVAGFLIGSR